jgi:lysophospholipase L1-like esterase
LADKRSVVIFNIHADRRWTEPNNQLLEKYRALYPRYLFVDWNAVALHHPEYFRKDGIHLTVEGMRVFAALAKQAFNVPDAPETHAPLSN